METLFLCRALICLCKIHFLFLLGGASISHGHKTATFKQHVKWKSCERNGARERRPHPTVSLRVIGVLNCDRAKALILIDVTFTCGDIKGSDHSPSVPLDIHETGMGMRQEREGNNRTCKNLLKLNDLWHFK